MKPPELRALLLLLAVGILVVPTAVVHAQPAVPEGSLGIQLLDAPVSRAEDPRALVYIVDHVGPGTSFSRRVQVVSGLAGPRAVELEVAAADIQDGVFTIRDDVRTPLLDWVTLDSESVSLDQQESAVVRVGFDVPAGAPEGEYYGAVLAGVSTSTGTGVGAVSRVGVRIYLSVGEGGEPAPNFSIVGMTPGRSASGNPRVSVEVENSGGRALDITGDLSLSEGPGGTSAGPFQHASPLTLAPGQIGAIDFGPLPDGLPAGPWLARADLASGLIERSAEATISFPDEAGTTSDPVEATPIFRDRNFLIPLALGLLILALLLVFLVWWLRRRREDEDGDHPEGGAPVAEEQTTVPAGDSGD